MTHRRNYKRSRRAEKVRNAQERYEKELKTYDKAVERCEHVRNTPILVLAEECKDGTYVPANIPKKYRDRENIKLEEIEEVK